VSLSAGLVAAGLTLLGAGLRLPRAPAAAAMPTPLGAEGAPTPEREYRLYCGSCHGGDRLMGLTADWIAQWPADDQNCWKSKCHSFNHPQDGFILPHDIPPLAGPGALADFKTAADLFAFVRASMPFQEPGWLTDEQYWTVVGYVLSRNGVALPEKLGPDNAADVVLHQGAAAASASAPTETAVSIPGGTATASGMRPEVAAVAVVIGVAVGVALFVRRRRQASS
jgi:hypothetical protein